MKQTSLIDRLYKIAENSIPTYIDRTDDGEFVIQQYYPELSTTEDGDKVVNGKVLNVNYDKEGNPIFNRKVKKELAYFMNEECSLCFRNAKGKMKAYFYGDGDNEYHFNIDVNEKMTDKEISIELIKGFSDKFGWVELFEDGIEKTKGTDVKFWAVFTCKNKKKLIEVGRDFFDQHIRAEEESENFDFDSDDDDLETPEYDKLIGLSCDIAKKHFKGLDINKIYAECCRLDKKDIKECAFINISIINL